MFCGSPKQVADQMEEWFTAPACDGFVLAATHMPGSYEDVVRLLDETSHAIQFNRELLRAALEHLPQGISVVDQELRLVAWNRRYIELLDYPEGLIAMGRPIEEVFRYNGQRGLLGGGEGGDAEEMIARRLAHMRAGHAYTH